MPRRVRTARDKNEPKIIKVMETMGAVVEKIDRPVDLLCAYHGLNILIEVKPLGKRNHRSTKTQKDWWERPWPGPRYIVETPQEAAQALLSAAKDAGQRSPR